MSSIFTPHCLSTPCSTSHYCIPLITTHRHGHKPTIKPRRVTKSPSYILHFPRHFTPLCFSRLPSSPKPPKPSKSLFQSSPETSYTCIKQDRKGGVGGIVQVFRVLWIEENDVFFRYVLKPMVFTLLWLVIGLCPIRGFQPPVAALPSISELIWWRKKTDIFHHKYSGYTRRLLEEVSIVLKMIEEARASKRDVQDVEKALKVVKMKKQKLQEEIMKGLYAELRELYRQRDDLVGASDQVLERATRAKEDKVAGKKMENLTGVLDALENEYNGLAEKVADVEDQIERKETMAFSIGVRELSFVERECELLVSRFVQEMRRGTSRSLQESTAARVSREDIKNGLEAAQREYLRQMILPSLVEEVEAQGLPSEGYSTGFAMRIKQALDESKDLQKQLEDDVRKRMKRFGKEKRFVVNTPEEEIAKGYPEVELKWMFGNKEVVVPKAIRSLLFRGWERWREKKKAELKRELLENVDLGRQYMLRRQEYIILDRDRILSKTVFNKDKNRWEMDPIAVPFAVSKKLVELARIRHDWGAMFVSLKGDDKEYHVDIKEYEMLFEDFGGFDALYLKMVASGIPTAVHVMWIPFSEWSLYQYCRLSATLAYQLWHDISNNQILNRIVGWTILTIKNATEDVLVKIVLPLVEFVIPYPLRLILRMAEKEEIYEVEPSTWYTIWKSEMQSRVELRIWDNIYLWIPWLLFRAYVYGYVLYYLVPFMRSNAPRFNALQPVWSSANWRKFRRVRSYFYLKKLRRKLARKRDRGNPIKEVFDDMKRVKNPPIPLKDFVSIDAMKEEIDEVVTFLKNPSAFLKVGARAPRGILIIGEHGTGKTSLALAIAAEAAVPMIQVKPRQLESETMVGRSAANVRELFETARDLAPVIIFVEDFDLFAGARGKFIHTKRQDHEAFINQLLVELDGFEKQEGVFLLATARNLKNIDPALKRPGRMDRIFRLQPPTQREREKILQIAARETMDPELVDFVDWRKVAAKTDLLGPIELKHIPMALEANAFRSKFLDADELMSYCSWFAALSGAFPKWLRESKPGRRMSNFLVNHLGLTLTKEDLESVVDLMEPYGQIDNGIELLNPSPDWTRETKYPHAVWAAGRGLIALLLPNFDVVENIWLEPFSWKGIGCTKITKVMEEGSMRANVETISYLEKKLVFCFGSHVAAQMLLPFGEENLLSARELKQAQEISTRMVIQYGWGPDDSPAIYHHGTAARVADMEMETNHKFEMATKVQKIYDLAYDKAKEMLLKNRAVLEKIVDELLEFDMLIGKDLDRVVQNHGGIREVEPFSLTRVYGEQSLSITYLEDGSPSRNALITMG
ncbi:hypothetical protein Dimus_021566 [Dionaea muscipula]